MTEPSFYGLMDLVRGFRPAKVLLVANDLGVFDHLESPLSSSQIAARVGADPRALGILLNALAALEVLVKEGDAFRNGEAASRYLVHGKEEYRGAILRHMHHTWWGWSELGETVVQGAPREQEPERWLDRHAETSGDWMRDFIWGMHALARDLAPAVAEKLDLKGVRRLLDLGGGPATYAITFAQAEPGLTATVFDLPGPIEIARENIARHALQDRVATLAGNFLQDGIGSDYDFIWISHILHSHDEAQCRLILEKAVRALNPGGRLAVQDFFLNDDGCTPVEAALFSVHMLAVTPAGRSYTWRETAAWLEELGLSGPVQVDTGPATSMLVARKG
ncbi:MAG: methyltransferase domain-containing protein [Deltaproteobacteria bacterium]|nr:methyltransferase domain-containing protein [Deltaproteobacteria bacterium]